MLRKDLIKNKIYGIIFIVLGALTIPIEWDATFFLFTLMLGVFIICIKRKLHYELRRRLYEPG